MIIVLVKRGKKMLRELYTIRNKLADINGSKKLLTHTYGIIDETDVDFLRASDVYAMTDEEMKRHFKVMGRLEELLKEAK